MKNTLTLSFAAAFLILSLLNANTSGPAHQGNGNKTGGPGSTGTCQSCHQSSQGKTVLNLEIREKQTQVLVSHSYTPHTDYEITIKGMHPSLSLFGFQLMAILSNQSDAGQFGNLGTDLHQITIGGKTLLEHHHPLSADPQGTIARFDWTSPGPGSGKVEFYGILNAVNGDNSNSGDASGEPRSWTLSESTTFVAEASSFSHLISAYPNPAHQSLTIELSPHLSSPSIQIFDLGGKRWFETRLDKTQPFLEVDLGTWTPGFYIIHMVEEGRLHKASFLKR